MKRCMDLSNLKLKSRPKAIRVRIIHRQLCSIYFSAGKVCHCAIASSPSRHAQYYSVEPVIHGSLGSIQCSALEHARVAVKGCQLIFYLPADFRLGDVLLDM